MAMLTHRALVLGCLIVATAAVGCTDYTEDVQAHYDKWKAQGIEDYVFVWQQRCFCGSTGGVRVTVRDGKVISAVSTMTGEPEEEYYAHTIDELFDEAIEYADDGPDDFDAAYSDEYAYISEYSVDPDTNTADEEYGIAITCFEANTTASTACPLKGITAEKCKQQLGWPVSDPDHTRKCPNDVAGALIGVIGEWDDSDELCCRN
jgi:uncharacterized protein DUF6174